MTRPCLKNRSNSLLSLLLLLCLTLISPGSSAEISLRPFSARYDLYHGGMYIAVTELSLQRSGEHWRWSTLTTARGIYSWFTGKRPYTETTFSQVECEILLREILIADAGSDRKTESARFNWGNSKLDVKRKGKQKQLHLSDPVYDYQSIHLLAAAMHQQHLNQQTTDFYRKGKLVKSSLSYSGSDKIDVNGKSVNAIVYEQVIVKSDSTIKYYYDAENPLLPLRIVKLKPGKKPSILKLRKVDWSL